jgi:phosphatidate cytidylyltransferase
LIGNAISAAGESRFTRDMLKHRLASAVIGAPLIILLAWLGGGWTIALVAAAASIGLIEFHRLSYREGATPQLFLGVVAVVLFAVEAAVEFDFARPLLVGAFIAPLLLLIVLPQKERLLTDWAWTIAGVLLIGWTLSHAVLLRALSDGREWLLFLIVLTFAIDTGAYTVGRLAGRRPMAPTISPGKTWEGAFGALAAGIGVSVALVSIYDLGIGVWDSIIVGGLIGFFSQAGDLALSLVKRAAGVKNASGLIPGHGGILDRLDSLILAVLVLYYFLQYR